MPSSLAISTSGTVLAPTTSAPAVLKNRPSADDSYVGPVTHAYVPSARVSLEDSSVFVKYALNANFRRVEE